MKILHIFDHSLPIYSGYSFRSKNILHCLLRRGIDVLALTSLKHNIALHKQYVPTYEIQDGLSFYRCQTRCISLYKLPVLSNFFIMLNLFFRLRKLVLKEKPDILHAHSPFLNVLPALLVGFFYKIPVFYEIRAFWEDAAVDHGTIKENSFLYKVYKRTETFLLQYVDQIFPISQGLKRDLVSRGILAEKITVIPNAMDLSEGDENLSHSLSAQSNKQRQSITLGFIGSLYAYEGLDIAINALKLLSNSPGYKIHLIIAGSGPQEKNLQHLTKLLNLESSVTFLGKVSHKEIIHVYEKIDILVFPRKKMRLTDLVTPLKPLEAMFYKKIVVASDVGGHCELIQHNETGYLFTADQPKEMADMLLQVFSNIGDWQRIIKNGVLFLEKERNWERNAVLYQEAYEHFLKKEEAIPNLSA